jgi:ubiquinone biosynthesis protein
LLNIEGLGRQMHPDLDIWQTAAPILRQWMTERISGAAMLGNLRTQLPEIIEAARALPPLLRGAVQRAQDGTLRLQIEAKGLDQSVESLKQTMQRSDRRRDAITIGAALLLGGIVWLAVGRDPAWAGGVLAAVGAGWILLYLRR